MHIWLMQNREYTRLEILFKKCKELDEYQKHFWE